MGYELHIIRQTNYDNEEEPSNISLDEWLAYVVADPELKLTNGYQSKLPGVDTSWHDVPGFCYWLKHPAGDSDTKPWFNYGLGCVSAKYPDYDTIKKMIEIADVLNAKVRGNHSEFYDETYIANNGRLTGESDIKVDTDIRTTSTSKPWWKFW